jgi:mannose-6-phosphate isomerase-like protein (cupin superfamily)
MIEELAKVVEEIQAEERPYLFGRHVFQGQTLEMAQVSVKPGASMPEHVHEDGEQCYYILSGQGLLVIDGKSYELTPGMAAFVPMGVEHHTENPGDELFSYVEARSKPAEE